jgi:hypothetical protein
LQGIRDEANGADYRDLLNRNFNNPVFKESDLHRCILDLDSRLIITSNFDKIYDRRRRLSAAPPSEKRYSLSRANFRGGRSGPHLWARPLVKCREQLRPLLEGITDYFQFVRMDKLVTPAC